MHQFIKFSFQFNCTLPLGTACAKGTLLDGWMGQLYHKNPHGKFDDQYISQDKSVGEADVALQLAPKTNLQVFFNIWCIWMPIGSQ